MPSKHKGFTLIELIMVIVIMSILSLTIVPKLTDTSVLTQKQRIDQFIAELHHAKYRAKQSLCPITLSIFEQDYQFKAAANCASHINGWTNQQSEKGLNFSTSMQLIFQPDGRMLNSNPNPNSKQNYYKQHSLIVSNEQHQTELVFYGTTGFIDIKE